MEALVVWWIVVEVLGLIALPLTFRLFSARAGHGYIFGKIIALLVVSYVSWLLTHLGVLPFHRSLPLTMAAFAGLNLWLAWRDAAALRAWLGGPGGRVVLMHDVFWTLGFLFFAWQRALGPEIFGAEKYMDFAFFNTLTRTDVFPPQDPWMAAKTFNYYYFGYLTFANLARLAQVVPNHIAYNLCVVTVGGLAFAEFAAVGWMLSRRWVVGALSGTVGMVVGNLDGFVQLLEKGGFTAFDYWRSSRIVAKGDTINEFPYFTTIHGDLHPHFIVLPVTVLLLALLLDPERFAAATTPGPGTRRAKAVLGAGVTFVLASMVVISPWELPVGAMMVFLLLGRHVPLRPLVSWPRIFVALTVAAMLLAAYVLYAPFYLNFTAPPGGVGMKFAQTSLVEFVIVFGALLFPVVAYAGAEAAATLAVRGEQKHLIGAATVLLVVISYLAGNAVVTVLCGLAAATLACAYTTPDLERRAALLLVLGATIALLACEFVYIKDPYGARLYRMNTVFKLYFQSWIVLAIAAPWCWWQLLDRRWAASGVRGLSIAVGAALLLAACAYPVGITATRMSHRFAPVTLDGNEYLQREHADDFAAIRWLREHAEGLPVLLEATGDPYSYYARFSSNTGLPTVLGWANHEGLWRNHEAEVGKRRADVERLYNAPALDQVRELLDYYRVTYVLVGEIERKDYDAAGLEKFRELPVAFTRGGTTIYRR